MSSRPHGWRRVEECAPVLSRDLVTNFLLQQWLHFHPHVASQPLCVPRAPNKPSLCCLIPLHCHSKLNLYFSRKPSARSLLYELIGRWNMDLSGQRKLPANNGFSLTQLQPDGIDKHWLFQTHHVTKRSLCYVWFLSKICWNPKVKQICFFVNFTFSEVFGSLICSL